METITDKILGKGTIGKLFSSESIEELMKITNAKAGDSIFFACGTKEAVEKILSKARTKIADDLNLI